MIKQVFSGGRFISVTNSSTLAPPPPPAPLSGGGGAVGARCALASAVSREWGALEQRMEN